MWHIANEVVCAHRMLQGMKCMIELLIHVTRFIGSWVCVEEVLGIIFHMCIFTSLFFTTQHAPNHMLNSSFILSHWNMLNSAIKGSTFIFHVENNGF